MSHPANINKDTSAWDCLQAGEESFWRFICRGSNHLKLVSLPTIDAIPFSVESMRVVEYYAR